MNKQANEETIICNNDAYLHGGCGSAGADRGSDGLCEDGGVPGADRTGYVGT